MMHTIFDRRGFCALALICGVTMHIWAGEPGEEEGKPEVAETVVVWATEVQTSSVQMGKEAMTIRQPDHISDLLRTIPGVDVGGAHSLNQRITIRSMDDKDLRISIDGASQNSYMYHHMGNLQIHADILKSVEIDVGKNSVLQGGLGGSVRFRTKAAKDLLQPGQSFGARLQGVYGSNASEGFSVTGYGQLSERFDVLAYYHFDDSRDYEVGGGVIRDSVGNPVSGTDGEVKGHEGSLEDMLVKFGADFGLGHRLEVGYESYEDEGDYSYRPDMGLATDLTIADNLGLPLIYPTRFTRDTLSLNYDVLIGSHTTIQATLFFNVSDLERDESGVAAVFGGASQIEGSAENTGLRLLASSTIDGNIVHEFTYGLDRVEYETEYVTDGSFASGEEAVGTALFVEDTIKVTDDLTLVPGVRYDHEDLDSVLVNDSFDRVTAGLAVRYTAGDFRLSVGTTQLFKSPEIGEVFIGAGLFDSPNPDIQAEKGLNSEVGLAFERAAMKADRFSFGFTLFQTELENFIYDYVRTATFRGKDNVGDMEVSGLEAYVGYDRGGFQGLISFASADSELDAFKDYSFLDGAGLDRRQGDNLSVNLDYRLGDYGLDLHWDSLIVSDVNTGLYLDSATLDNAKDDYAVHNLSLRWSPIRLADLSITLGVDNVFDKYYASQSSRTGVSFHPRFGELYLLDYEPGRNIKATLAYRF